MPRKSNISERYRRFMAAAPSPEAARRRIVECARRHGTMAAARMSSASKNTVRRLVRWADAGRSLADKLARPHLSARDEGRIVAAKRAHPTEGTGLLRRNGRVPYSCQTISRVLRETGLQRKQHVPTRDPDFRIRICTGRVWIAEQELKVAEIAHSVSYPGRASEVERIRRRLEVAERKLEWWKSEKVRRERDR